MIHITQFDLYKDSWQLWGNFCYASSVLCIHQSDKLSGIARTAINFSAPIFHPNMFLHATLVGTLCVINANFKIVTLWVKLTRNIFD